MSLASLLTSLSGLWAIKADALTSLVDAVAIRKVSLSPAHCRADSLQPLADVPPGMAAAAQRSAAATTLAARPTERREAFPLGESTSPYGNREQSEGSSRTGRAGEPMYVKDGPVAIVPVTGALTKNGLRLFGMDLLASMRGIGAALQQAEADPAVRAILLDVDSPGGTVDGIEELAAAVTTAGAGKPLYAYADGLMASAAYWLSCGAREIAAPATAEVGSIGVVMLHREMSKALEEVGIKYTVIAAGHYKAAGNSVEPLSDEMRAYLQSGIDDTYELFLQAVERGRGVSREKALTMADGRIFIAGEALKAGLIDRVCSRAAFISHIKESTVMNLAELKAQHPDAVRELRAELEASAAAAAAQVQDSARDEAAKAEQDRVLALAGAVLGEEAASRLKVVAASGVSPDVLASLQGVLGGTPAADTKRDAQKEALDALKAAAAGKPLSPLVALGEEENKAAPDFDALVAAHIKTEGVSRGAAIQAMAAAHPEEHQAWIDAQQKGRK